MKTITVWDSEEYEEYKYELPPENIEELIIWLKSKLDIIPEEYRASAQMDIIPAEQYGFDTIHVTISYTKQEER